VGKIITKDLTHKYKIEKFVFKQYKPKSAKKADLSSIFKPSKVEKHIEDKSEQQDDSKVKELLLKIEELSSQIVNLQMQLEEKEKEHQKELIKVKDEAYQKGIKDTKEANENEIEELKIQYLSSATKLGELELAIKDKFSKIEEELIETSIIIANKVIKKEVEENSALVAKSIAKYLLSSLKDELDIKILVNPVDYEEVLKQEAKEGITVVSDSSIQRGGVVIQSPKKNLDGTISTRFKKTLQLIKES